MIGWQITEKGKIETIDKTEMLDGIDRAKIRITKALFTEEDAALMLGEDKSVKFPYVPCRMAVGQISELGQESAYLSKGTRVYLSPIRPCGACSHCTNDRPEDCYSFSIAGYNSDGFLKEFAVKPLDEIHVLPPSVKDESAVYIEYISLALSVIDKLEIKKGQHVAIIGADVFGSILAQLIIYYQGVPIILDDDENKLMLAQKSGVYYTVTANAKAEKEVSSITGGRMASKVVYVSRSKLPADLAFKLCAPYEKIAFAGLFSTNAKVSLTTAIQKSQSIICVTNGYGNIEPAINILANSAIDLSNYDLKPIQTGDIIPSVNAMAENYKAGKPVENLIVNMLA